MRLASLHSLPTWPLHAVSATREIERQILRDESDDRWMLEAGAVAANLARAIAPHARRIGVACGSGHNGGDGYAMAAALCHALTACGANVYVMQTGSSALSPLTQTMRWRALEAGATEVHAWPDDLDLAVDAISGIGAQGNPRAAIADLLLKMHRAPCFLALDVPTGLHADTGEWMIDPSLLPPPPMSQSRHTLSLITVKPGLLTGAGRDWSGTVWISSLGAAWSDTPQNQAKATLGNQPWPKRESLHQAHKGSFGDVTVLAGQAPTATRTGMLGAAVLAARSALHAGAGRVTWVPLGESRDALPTLDPGQPDVMIQHLEYWLRGPQPSGSVWVVGCGGGEAVAEILPLALAHPRAVVLDADALNHIAQDAALKQRFCARGQRGWIQVFTPHPLEAARLLGLSSAQVQRDRLGCAQAIAEQLWGIVVLKGSGSITAAPNLPPIVNASGNARLAVGGTGDVLAGAIAGRLAAHRNTLQPDQAEPNWGAHQSHVAATVWEHGHLADTWPAHQSMTASALAAAFVRA